MKTIRIVNGLTHVDLAWKKGETEMAELFDLFVLRVIDLCERNPDYRYLLEQASHFRSLKSRRPDLFEKIRAMVSAGRLELASNQASSIELNVVNGESIVRDMQIGRRWFNDNFGMVSQTCAMIDTFGFPPQMPQLLNQFGHKSLFADRFGAYHDRDVFRVRGLDGSQLLVVGPDIKSPYLRPGHVNMMLCREHKHFEMLFERANANDTDLQFTLAYTENETAPMERVEACMREANIGHRFGTMNEFMRALETRAEEFDVLSADLNPELTGTFSLRHRLRLENRRAETMLLNVEKLAALMGTEEYDERVEALWWEMGYLQFHDVITGSHPTAVYRDCLKRFDAVRSSAGDMARDLIADAQPYVADGRYVVTVWNGLSAPRDCRLEIALPEGWDGVGEVRMAEEPVAGFEVSSDKLILNATLDPLSTAQIEIVRGAGRTPLKRAGLACLDNGLLRVEIGGRHMIDRIVSKKDGTVIMKDRDDLLVLQGDSGCFQIEQPIDSEIAAGAGDYTVNLIREGSVQTARIVGTFPSTEYGRVGYELELMLADDAHSLGIRARIDWAAHSARLRLKLNTELGMTRNYYEVPFGVAVRKPYGVRKTARGEWAAHRFVAMEEETSRRGVALFNSGTVGVEAADGTMWTTLLRAPTYGEYVNLECDDTSSDHGVHDFAFMLVPYAGDWASASIARLAQAFNDPPIIAPGRARKACERFSCDAKNIMLSAIKRAGCGMISIRFYETAGKETDARVEFSALAQAYETDLREAPGAPIQRRGNSVLLRFKPFEIKTLLVKFE